MTNLITGNIENRGEIWGIDKMSDDKKYLIKTIEKKRKDGTTYIFGVFKKVKKKELPW